MTRFLIALFTALLWTAQASPLRAADLLRELHRDDRIRRDPFLPVRETPIVETTTRPLRKPIPLEQHDLEDLTVVGIVWQIRPRKAIVEDDRGMGYIVGLGTRIGRKRGRVKAILPDRIVVKQSYTDARGARIQKRISMMLSR